MEAPGQSILRTRIESYGLGETTTTKTHWHGLGALVQIPIFGYASPTPNLRNRISPDLTDSFPAHADRHMTVGMNIQPCIRQVAQRRPGRLLCRIVCLN